MQKESYRHFVEPTEFVPQDFSLPEPVRISVTNNDADDPSMIAALGLQRLKILTKSSTMTTEARRTLSMPAVLTGDLESRTTQVMVYRHSKTVDEHASIHDEVFLLPSNRQNCVMFIFDL